VSVSYVWESLRMMQVRKESYCLVGMNAPTLTAKSYIIVLCKHCSCIHFFLMWHRRPMYCLYIIVHYSGIILSIRTNLFTECVLTMFLTLIHSAILASTHGSPSPVSYATVITNDRLLQRAANASDFSSKYYAFA